MTTLTSTGAVNLTASTNWSPAQVPVAGDDLVIGAHTLTLDADLALNTITINHASCRFAISGTTRAVGATNGFVVAAGMTGGLISTTLTTGMSVTLTGKWIWNSNFGISPLVASTGGNLTLQTVGADESAILFDYVALSVAQFTVICASWTGGTLTTIGRFNAATYIGASTLITMSGGTWSHQSTGTNSFGPSQHRICALSGTATLNWTGSVDSQSSMANAGEFTLTSSSASHTIGQAGDTFLIRNTPVLANQWTTLVYIQSGTVELTGQFTSRSDAITLYSVGASTIRLRNQSMTIPSTDYFLSYHLGATCDFSGLVISNAGKFMHFDGGASTTTTTAGTSITCTSTSATACAVGTTALDGKIVTLESNPPTLPAVADVAAGEVYGYTGIELTGTGLIMDPATLATAMLTSFGSLPEVLTKTTIATLSSQTSFTLTAGSADDDVYNNMTAIITDQSTSVQKAVVTVSDYVGSTKTVTLSSAPGFTIATGDLITVIAGSSGGGGSFPSEAPADWLKSAGIQDGAFTAAKFAASALNGKGDWSTYAGGDTSGTTTLLSRLTSTRAGNLDLLDVAISTLQSQITALNNLSAKCNWFGSLLLEIPDAGTRAYVFELVVKDDEDKLTNLDASPTIALVNSSGTDRSSLITTGIANPATGRYTLTITVEASTANESLKLTASGTVSGESRYAVLAPQVVDYDSAELINSIYNRIGAPAGASVSADIAAGKVVVDAINTKVGTPAGASVAADIAAVKSDTGSLITSMASLVGKFTGVTLIKNWLGALAGKTADTTTRTEINATTAGATFNETTDSLEAVRDRGDAAWTTGAGGGNTSLTEEDILAIASAVRALPNVNTGSARTGITLIRTDRFQQNFSVTPGTYTRIIWSLKRKASDTDDEALLTVDSIDGITRLNGAAPTVPQEVMGTLTYSSGTVTLDVLAEITTLLPVGDNFVDGIKVLPANRHLRNGPASAKVVEGIVRETD